MCLANICRSTITDPWYSGDFDRTYEDVIKGCESFLKSIQ